MSEAPLVSVVVIGRNEGERLVRCLKSVKRLRPPGGAFEIIYVDSASTDGSPDAARRAGARVIELTNPRPTPAQGRNAGWRAARAPFILFVDGDTVLEKDFVARALPGFDNPRVAVVWGRLRELDPHASIYKRVYDIHWIRPAPGETETCLGVCLARRSALEAVGGYDPVLVAEEEGELCRRLRRRGFAILHVKVPMAWHDLAMTRLSQYWLRALRTGYARAQVVRRCRHADPAAGRARVRENRIWGALLVLAPVASLTASVLLRSAAPTVLVGLLLLALVLRMAWRCRERSGRPIFLLLYSLHWHVRQVPMILGHFLFVRDSWTGNTKRVFDYKG